ncbi:hypothetical protein GF318_02795 [Candidatus Micrarchaeota archaeon]|nr:hypothetical protein [Candidatus Micrarchaeota archaeon]
MISRQRAVLNILVLASPLFLGLAYVLLARVDFPYSIVIPTTGGGIMNFCFWFFYNQSIKPVPELSNSILGKNRKGFLFVGLLHLVAILVLLAYDISWVF